jgi:hypothetical protein
MAVIKNEYFIPNKIMLEKFIGKILRPCFLLAARFFSRHL